MSNVARVAGQAANTTGKPLSVENVFSTYLYDGTNDDGPNPEQTITNGIDLAGEGGMVWIKARDYSANHALVDTVRGNTKYLESSTTSAEKTTSVGITAFNSNGFSLGADNTWQFNTNNAYVSEYASWTFRKAPKFFDVVTWTGDGTTGRAISHNLGCEVGTIFVKATNANSNWYVYNRNLTSANYGLKLNGTDAAAFWGTGNVTDTTFSFDHQNGSGNTYVAYLFAHNDGDGGFGDGTQDIIKCGSFTSTSGTDEIDLGFEPQWILIKRADASNSWVLVDELRGNPVGSAANYLEPNGSFAESTLTGWTTPTPTGFTNSYPLAGGTFIYIAIRRGPMAVPTDATEVFAIDTANSTGNAPPVWNSGFPVDMAFYNVITGGDKTVLSRMTGGQYLIFNATNAEAFDDDGWDFMDGWYDASFTNSNFYSWMWKRAPNYFDVVAYTGNSTAGRTVSHNLGVAPEMMWVKRRDTASGTGWFAYHKDLTSAAYYLNVNSTAAESQYWNAWNSTAPTSSVFSLGNYSDVNLSGGTYIAYLFASLDGVSKVGSYTGNGTSQTIDCGFSSGARFVLIKSSSGSGGWFVFDIERGITSNATDGSLQINETHQEYTETEWFGLNAISPDTSGFTVEASINSSGVSYIFYAIA